MNTRESELPQRQSIRLNGYDYSQAGAYFVTSCAREKETLFGDMRDRALRLSDLGQLVWVCWNAIPEHFVDVQLDEFVVMPNHVQWNIGSRRQQRYGRSMLRPYEGKG